jgi:hypothetical protein
MVHNLTDLAGTIGCEDSVAAISKALFKGTDCGIVFDGGHDYVSVCGYAEGVDAECVPYKLHYPFSTKQFWACVNLADADGVEMWLEGRDEFELFDECDAEWDEYWAKQDGDMQDTIDDDNAQRAADMNATLNGGW